MLCSAAESVYGTSCADQSGDSAAEVAVKQALRSNPLSRGEPNTVYDNIGGPELWLELRAALAPHSSGNQDSSDSDGEWEDADGSEDDSASEDCRVAPGTRVLVLTDLGNFEAGDDPILDPLFEDLQATGLILDQVPFAKGKGKELAQKLAGGCYRACIIPNLGSGTSFKPSQPTFPFVDGPWKTALTAWVAAGGVLLMHGERAAAAVLSSWFDKRTWKAGQYARTEHQLNSQCPLVQGCLTALPREYSVKACMLTGVAREECVYSAPAGSVQRSMVFGAEPIDTGACSVAAGKYGSGKIAYWGDVNCEDHTHTVVVELLLHMLQ